MSFSRIIVKIVEKFNPTLAGKLSFRMFCRTKLALPRSIEMNIMNKSQREFITINDLKVTTYQWGNSDKVILLLHGWESRASRFYAFIKELMENGYQVISFDAPGHGESEGKSTNILENYAIIKQLQDKYGSFDSIIAHSIGVLNAFFALKQDIRTKSVIAISGVSDFSYLYEKYASFLGINQKTRGHFKKCIERFFYQINDIWTHFSAHCEPEKLLSHICIIHDKDDKDVTITQSELLYSAYNTKANMHVTSNLGHLRILSDPNVIKLSINHIKASNLN